MPDIFLKYFEDRLSKTTKGTKSNAGFITISRQTGCNGNSIAAKLATQLSRQNKWKFINKEVLDESAKKLSLKKSKISHLFNAEHLSHADEIMSAFSSRYYKSDRKLKKTVSDVIRHYAKEGDIIIVGRAGVGITMDMPNSLHIRIEAPLEWRINSLKKRKGFENIDFEKFVVDQERKRTRLLERFCKISFDDIVFDLTINRDRFTEQQIVDLIIQSMKLKKLC